MKMKTYRRRSTEVPLDAHKGIVWELVDWIKHLSVKLYKFMTKPNPFEE